MLVLTLMRWVSVSARSFLFKDPVRSQFYIMYNGHYLTQTTTNLYDIRRISNK
jgi:hypothetical protein